MWPFKPKNDLAEAIKLEVNQAVGQLSSSGLTNNSVRGRIASAISGGYDNADTLHNIYLDYGYPSTLSFANFWNMYRRFGVAKNVVELPVDTSWMTTPTIESENGQFISDLDDLIPRIKLWQRLKGLDTRQRVGRYAGLFMRVRDNKSPDQPIDGTLAGIASLVQVTPIYEGELEVLETDSDPSSDRYELPTMYQYTSGASGNRNEKSKSTFSIHPDRIIIAAEGADNGGIYGIPSLEACYNSLMDLRKIAGGGGEGYYKNAAQSLVFSLKDGASAVGLEKKLEDFADHTDDFLKNRARRSMWSPNMDAQVLSSNLANPKEFFMNSLNDVAAAAKIPATILIGQQTGRMASNEDSRSFLSMVNSRRENFVTEMIESVIDWFVFRGILPAADYDVVWDDLLALSDNEKLDNATKMSAINQTQFQSAGEVPFDGEEIREAAGFELDRDLEEPEGEEIGQEIED